MRVVDDDCAVVAEFAFDVRTSSWTWSPGLYHLHGLATTEQPHTEHLLQRACAEDVHALESRLRHLLNQPGLDTWTYRMIDGAGRVRHLRWVATAVAEGRDVTRLEGFVLDVTADVRDWQTEAVEAAVEHRAAIEQAKGALMIALDLNDDEAFDVLRSLSNHRNEKLWTVARDLICAMRDHSSLDGDPLGVLHLPTLATLRRASTDASADGPRQGAESVLLAESGQP